MSAHSHSSHHLSSTLGHLGFGALVDTLMITFATMYRRHQERQSLRHLDDRMLEDIGVSYGDALREADKPFWQA